MQPYTDLLNKLDDLEIDFIKTNKKVELSNVACGFDIETTSTTVQGEKSAFMYIWQFGINHGEAIYYGRHWREFVQVCNALTERFKLGKDKRLVIYVHNLGYEFQFMMNYFTWADVFAVDERKPIKAITSCGIEFRCSYILSGFSLANTAKNLTKYEVKKMVGDLDYSLIRTPETELTELELGYCENDIAIVTAYIQEQIDYYGDIGKIPMTNTGRVRKHVRHECYYTDKNHRKSSKKKYYEYRKIMNDLTIDAPTYIQLKRAFMGGFTHANANYSGKVLNDVSSIDFTSSYPSVMVAEKFPMSRFRPVQFKSIAELEKHCLIHAVVFDVKLTGVTSKLKQESYLSESKCFNLSGAVLDNGRVVQAESLVTTLTDVDYQILKQVYNWETIAVSNAKFAYKNYLPKSIIKSILDLYQDKTVLKDVQGMEVEYLLSKGMLNSVYGMSVTDIVKDKSIFNGAWGTEPVSIEEEIEKYNTSKNRFLYYAWGLWVTAYARRNLWTGIIAVGDDYVYSDTDSLKLLNYDKHKGYIKWFDDGIISKMNAMCDYYKFDKKLLSPKTKDGKVKTLGIWDFEGTYQQFKTLGAKRYLVNENGNLQLTVAGLSKQNGVKYLIEQAEGDINKVFELFSDNLYVPASRTGKMTHTYIDEPMEFICEDYQGNSAIIKTLSGVHLESCDFTLSIAEQYRQFLQNLSKGYIYTGLKHI